MKQTANKLENLSFMYEWIEKHPKLTTTMLWIEALLTVLALLNYEFTTRV